ncbi:HAD-IB family hydrolase [Romboutsia maritimum]|uniref:HAD-IB family hydrolase n=1 Tax=Romboutsia maritimum TaxID=2020948 RepID=A0A371IR14_9FIRM|nr:HAD-IB family hydrolase [Romboutsia maritimum]RDY22919.1 HAD-IB family hydrolase [Romboutsia maritimum]
MLRKIKEVVLLDVDYTVINTDSMIDFFVYSLKTKTLKTIIKIPYIIVVFVMYLLKFATLNKAKEAVFSTIIYFKEDELEEFFNKCIKKKINESMMNIIEDAQKKGKIIIMVTASPSAYMKYFKKYKYADEVLGTELEFENSRYKNKILGNNCKGLEKTFRIEKLLEHLDIEINFDKSYAYSDSISDMPMFSLVANAYLVQKKDGKVKEKVNVVLN